MLGFYSFENVKEEKKFPKLWIF